MEAFTPSFVLQILFAAASAGMVYGAIRIDLANAHRRITEETRLREAADKDLRQAVHDMRDEHLVPLSNRVARLEGASRG